MIKFKNVLKLYFTCMTLNSYLQTVRAVEGFGMMLILLLLNLLIQGNHGKQ